MGWGAGFGWDVWGLITEGGRVGLQMNEEEKERKMHSDGVGGS